MGGGRYSTNNRVNAAAAAAAKQRAAALASGPAYPVVSDPVVNLPVKSVVQPAPEEFASLASPFDVDFSKLDFGGSGGYGGLDLNLSGLDIDALREAVNPTPVQPIDPPEGRAGTPTSLTTYGPNGKSYYQGIQSQDYGTGPKYDNPEDALTNYADFMSGVDSQVAQTKSKYNYNQFDPGDFARAGFSGPSSVGNQAASDKVTDYITKNNIPLSKVIDGKRQYLTTGSADSYAKLFGGDQFVGGDLVATGPVGSYSTTFQKDENLFTQVLNDPIIGLAANFIPGANVALTAAKAANGQSLSPADIVTLAVPALTKAGMLTAPVDAAAAAKASTDAVNAATAAGATASAAATAGAAAQKAALAGTGLASLGYNNSVALINAAATGDPTSVVTSLVGNTVIDKAFTGIEGGERVAGLFQADDLKTGLTKVVEKVASGEKFDDALLAGLGTYVKEGGTLRLPTPEGFDLDIDLGIIEDVVKAAVRPIEGIVRKAGRVIDDNVLQPVKEVGEEIGETLEPIVETVKEAGSVVDDTILQPVKETVEAGASVAGDVLSVVDDEVIQPVIQGVEEGASVAGDVLSAADTAVRDAASAFDDAVIQPAGDALSALDTAVRQALPDINGPDIDFPDIDLPDINLPNFNMPSFTLGNMGMMTGLLTPQPAPNRTTDSLFKNELFQFQTEIGADVEPIEYVDLGFSDPFEEQTLTQRYPF